MKLNLTDVLLEDKRFDQEVPIEIDRLDYSFGSFPITEKSGMRITVQKDGKKILDIHGTCSITVSIPCDRCLEDVQVPLELDFDERVPTGGDESPAAAESVPEDAAEEGSAFEPDYYLQGYYLDVDKLLFGEALLNWPSRVLCKEDCKGLCPVCGQNLNHGDCGCVRKALDPQMSKVLDIFSKFKEV